MNSDTYVALFWLAFCAAMTVTMLTSLYFEDRRREPKPNPFLTPWVDRAPGELPERRQP